MQNLGEQTRFIMGDVQVAYTTVPLELDPIFGFLACSELKTDPRIYLRCIVSHFQLFFMTCFFNFFLTFLISQEAGQ